MSPHFTGLRDSVLFIFMLLAPSPLPGTGQIFNMHSLKKRDRKEKPRTQKAASPHFCFSQMTANSCPGALWDPHLPMLSEELGISAGTI